MAPTSLIGTLASAKHRGAYLQMDGKNVTNSAAGSGRLSVGHGGGPLDQFRISPPPTDGSPYVTSFESVAYPGVYLRMDGKGVTRYEPGGGGKVNKQFGSWDYEQFIIQPQPNGTVAIESKAFPGVFLRLSIGVAPGENSVVVNCQFGVGPSEEFRLEAPPAAMRLRVLTYNTHLMRDSFIEEAARLERLVKRTPYVVWDDEMRRNIIIGNVVNSLADIVSLQEIWAPDWETHFIEWLSPTYPYAMKGKLNPYVPGSTSGLVLLSKFELTDGFFERFPDMTGLDYLTNKGVLGGVANIPGAGSLRIGTAHATGEVRDIQWIANKTITDSAAHKALPAMMLGDFNISWQKGTGNERYIAMKKVFTFPGAGINPASDSWVDVHGDGIVPDPYTAEMRYNTLHQLFSPERDTEPDTRIDYIWTKPGIAQAWSAKQAEVLRGPEWAYTSRNWHWAHKNVVARMPAAAVLGDTMLVVSKDGGSLGNSAGVLCAILNRKTSEWRHFYTGFNTTAPPGVVAYKGKFHLFYRDGGGNAIFHRSSTDGEKWTNHVSLGIDTGGSVFPIEFDKKIHLLSVDPGDGPGSLGGQIFCHVKTNDNDEWGRGNWTGRTGIGITTRSDISAAVFDNKLFVVSKDNGSDSDSSGLMWSILDRPGARWRPEHPANLITSGSPGVIAIGGRLHLYYRDPGGTAIYHASYDGKEWKEKDQNTLHDSMINGVCPVRFDGKLWLFYPYLNTTATAGGYYGDNMLLHAFMPEVRVDVSDHYPLMVDLEARTILANILVTIRGAGDVTFGDDAWAGTRGEALPLDGYQLNSRLQGLGFSYMGHIQNVGDTDWVPDGSYIGKRGESKQLEGFAIKLTGPAASSYRLTYRAHIQRQGDTAFFNEGDYCGTRNEGKAVEAMWIKLERK
jgi:endonuclease/exonuclease/phosphatase family metal-dependent hydrolase